MPQLLPTTPGCNCCRSAARRVSWFCGDRCCGSCRGNVLLQRCHRVQGVRQQAQRGVAHQRAAVLQPAREGRLGQAGRHSAAQQAQHDLAVRAGRPPGPAGTIRRGALCWSEHCAHTQTLYSRRVELPPHAGRAAQPAATVKVCAESPHCHNMHLRARTERPGGRAAACCIRSPATAACAIHLPVAAGSREKASESSSATASAGGVGRRFSEGQREQQRNCAHRGRKVEGGCGSVSEGRGMLLGRTAGWQRMPRVQRHNAP